MESTRSDDVQPGKRATRASGRAVFAACRGGSGGRSARASPGPGAIGHAASPICSTGSASWQHRSLPIRGKGSSGNPCDTAFPRWWLAVVGLGILAVGLYVAWGRLAPDSVPGILPDEIARPSPREEPPQAIAAAADSTAVESTPAEPELSDSW
ncbi:MAG: hypothetical protein IPJ97_09865 [Proteobacteria bacterium]|nr:hypothetical protein [Pseudomonadota bacterium]